VRALLLLATLAGCAAADAAEPAGAVRPDEIASISIEGRGVPAPELRELLASKPGTLLDDSLLAKDRESLHTALVTRGYLAATVGAPHITYDQRGAAFVSFAITRGPLYHVRSVELTGASERDAGIVTIAPGEPADMDHITRAQQAIETRLTARGKHLEVATRLHTDDHTATVDVVLAAK
jgi:outer membrane protein assembly factor BamA